LRVDLGKMKRGGLDAAFFVIFVEQGPRTPEGYARLPTRSGRPPRSRRSFASIRIASVLLPRPRTCSRITLTAAYRP
jgi:hypothetical protein